MLQIEAIAQGAAICIFLLAPHPKSVASGLRATISVEPCKFSGMLGKMKNFKEQLSKLEKGYP